MYSKSYLISTLPIFSKIFERLLSKQLLEFFDNVLAKFHCDFRKHYREHHCLSLMLEISKGASESNKAFGDVSKAFDC